MASPPGQFHVRDRTKKQNTPHGTHSRLAGAFGMCLTVQPLYRPTLKRLADRYQFTAFCGIDRSLVEHFAGFTDASMNDFTTQYHELPAGEDVDAVLNSLPISLNALPYRRTGTADHRR